MNTAGRMKVKMNYRVWR